MSESRLSGARILVVDDEESNVRALRRLLRAAGYTNILATTDPGEVRRLYRDQDPDLVLLDLHKPGLDGIGLPEQLRADAPPQTFLPMLMRRARVQRMR